MPSTSELAITVPTVEIMPMVIHNKSGRVVTANVLVSLDPDRQGITIEAAPIALPQKIWEVRWELMVQPAPGFTAAFSTRGILIDPKDLPPNVTVAPSGPEDTKDRCVRLIENNVQGA